MKSATETNIFSTVKKRDDVIPIYVNLIKNNSTNGEIHEVNSFIIGKWSSSALIYIKDKAWKFINATPKRDN